MWVAVCTDRCDASVFMVQVVGECIILEFRKGHMQVLIKILHEHKYLYSTFVQHDSKQKAIMRLSISKTYMVDRELFSDLWPLVAIVKAFPCVILQHAGNKNTLKLCMIFFWPALYLLVFFV